MTYPNGRVSFYGYDNSTQGTLRDRADRVAEIRLQYFTALLYEALSVCYGNEGQQADHGRGQRLGTSLGSTAQASNAQSVELLSSIVLVPMSSFIEYLIAVSLAAAFPGH